MYISDAHAFVLMLAAASPPPKLEFLLCQEAREKPGSIEATAFLQAVFQLLGSVTCLSLGTQHLPLGARSDPAPLSLSVPHVNSTAGKTRGFYRWCRGIPLNRAS